MIFNKAPGFSEVLSIYTGHEHCEPDHADERC
jgi:hypothetical protein